MPNTQAVGVAYADPEFTTCYASQELGYAPGAQGTVTQATSKSTGVTLNKSMGRITMNAASLASQTHVIFALTNNSIGPADVVTVSVSGGGTVGAYWPYVASTTTGSAQIGLFNNTANPLAEAVIINFCIIHGAA
jgi:hypothetical protein